jgi:glycosyltransferase involved in cell wall biosynthesis
MQGIDVVNPCYNYAAYLPQCVSSVLEQDDVRVRALIIDDCSTDDSADVGLSLARDAPRQVEFRRHATNLGHIETYNEGLLGWAEAELCLLLSADDVAAPGAFARAVRAFAQFPDAGMCYGRQIVFDTVLPRRQDAVESRRAAAKLTGLEFIALASRDGGNPVPTPTAIVRTILQRAVGGYRRELPHTADMHMWLALASRAPVLHLDAIQAYKRNHRTNMSKPFVQDLLPDLAQRRLAFETVLRDLPDSAEEERRLLHDALRAVAKEAFWAAHAVFERGQAAACDRLLRFAAEGDPSLVESASWTRLHWKRRMGRTAWRLVDQMRKRAGSSAFTAEPREP